eukprot:scaffold2830_cov123-Isochrysis_galbana.AAC.22
MPLPSAGRLTKQTISGACTGRSSSSLWIRKPRPDPRAKRDASSALTKAEVRKRRPRRILLEEATGPGAPRLGRERQWRVQVWWQGAPPPVRGHPQRVHHRPDREWERDRLAEPHRRPAAGAASKGTDAAEAAAHGGAGGHEQRERLGMLPRPAGHVDAPLDVVGVGPHACVQRPLAPRAEKVAGEGDVLPAPALASEQLVQPKVLRLQRDVLAAPAALRVPRLPERLKQQLVCPRARTQLFFMPAGGSRLGRRASSARRAASLASWCSRLHVAHTCASAGLIHCSSTSNSRSSSNVSSRGAAGAEFLSGKEVRDRTALDA